MEKERKSANCVREKWHGTSGDGGREDQMWDRGGGVREMITGGRRADKEAT